jgi:hypothetical protein
LLVHLCGQAASLLEEHLGSAVAEVGEDDRDELVRFIARLVGQREDEPLRLDASRYSPFQWISRRPGSANIVSRHEPPGLTSIETVDSGTSDSLPPNQSAKASGSAHSLHTPSRGASKIRVIVIPPSGARSAVGGSAIL